MKRTTVVLALALLGAAAPIEAINAQSFTNPTSVKQGGADVSWMDDAIPDLSAQGYSKADIQGVFQQYGYTVSSSVVNGVLAGTMSATQGLGQGLVKMTGADPAGMNNYLVSRGLEGLFDGGGGTNDPALNALLQMFARGNAGPGGVTCSSVAMDAVMAAGSAVAGFFSGGLATVVAQFSQQLQLLQANFCSGVTNDHLEASNKNEVIMIDYMIQMLKGTNWGNEQAAAAGIRLMAQALMGSGQVYNAGAVPGDYGKAYPRVYGADQDNERIIQESDAMMDRQRSAQIAAQRQQAVNAASIQARPARVAEIMASTRAAPGMTAAIQEQVKMGALQVEAISALHSDIIATERAKLNEMAREQQDKALEQRMFENAMAGWGECKRCGGATVGWEK
jgi:hypothetical protein